MDKEKVVKFWNDTSDSEWYNDYRTDEVINGIIENPKSAFHHKAWERILDNITNFKNKKICVPSSGDNHAVFAFALLGAEVTSCDISERQIENAKAIANRYNWEIEFVCDDTMSLSKIADNTYDFVYTSNGVHVWIDDLYAMYRSIFRILKNDGKYLMYEIHPFGRPFTYGNDVSDNKEIVVKKPYGDVGPHGLSYHWRIQDFINAVVSNGLIVTHMEEMFAEYGTYWFESSGGRGHLSEKELNELYDWKKNPLAGLPQWICISADKR